MTLPEHSTGGDCTERSAGSEREFSEGADCDGAGCPPEDAAHHRESVLRIEFRLRILKRTTCFLLCVFCFIEQHSFSVAVVVFLFCCLPRRRHPCYVASSSSGVLYVCYDALRLPSGPGSGVHCFSWTSILIMARGPAAGARVFAGTGPRHGRTQPPTHSRWPAQSR